MMLPGLGMCPDSRNSALAPLNPFADCHVGGAVRFIDVDWSATMTTLGLTSSAGKSEALTGWIAGNLVPQSLWTQRR